MLRTTDDCNQLIYSLNICISSIDPIVLFHLKRFNLGNCLGATGFHRTFQFFVILFALGKERRSCCSYFITCLLKCYFGLWKLEHVFLRHFSIAEKRVDAVLCSSLSSTMREYNFFHANIYCLAFVFHARTDPYYVQT